MATFVLVPGAWLGGWCWQRVTPLLRTHGHHVLTPTLTGLGERSHLAHPEIDLETHVTDVVNTILWEELHDVLLVGHSYSGLVVGSAADRVPERIAHVIYLDANLPTDGQSFLGAWSPAGRAIVEAEARAGGEGWRWPFPDDLEAPGADLTEDDLRWMRAKAVAHPLGTLTQPVRLAHPIAPPFPRTYIWCNEGLDDVPAHLAPIRAAADWQFRTLSARHWPMFSQAQALSALLNEIATSPTR
jgi:pimeloyl-ACP methyl ester carboxylesterase